jgi:Domain of unknown function(DUF2779)
MQFMLSKSDLASWRQCQRKLWLEKKRPDLEPGDEDATRWRRATDGQIVGKKAREQLGPNALWPRGGDTPDASALLAHAELAAHPQRAAAEVPMMREAVYARADALIPAEGGGYVLRETKASTVDLKSDGTPKDPEEHHLDDLAIQAWVYESTGWPLAAAELNLLNSQWKYPGHDNYDGLFRPVNISAAVQHRKTEVPSWIASAQGVIAGPMPEAITGRQCNDPHPCPFIEFCRPLDPPRPEHPISLLPGPAGKSLARRLQQTHNYSSLLEPSEHELTGKDAALYVRMQRAHRTGQAILEPMSGAVLAALPYPRYYFDFEGIDLPVPQWVGVRPYEQIPFQWSCHIERAPGRFEHAEFLDLTGNDPSLPCIQRMFEVMPPDGHGPIFVYFQTYEKTRLKEFGLRHPKHEGAMNAYIARLVDLLPIVQGNYYHPLMKGSFSIKKVLPTIAPELGYDALEEVQGGVAAQVGYLHAVFDTDMSNERRDQIRQRLLAYCAQDTWAMVELAYFLQRLGRPTTQQ